MLKTGIEAAFDGRLSVELDKRESIHPRIRPNHCQLRTASFGQTSAIVSWVNLLV